MRFVALAGVAALLSVAPAIAGQVSPQNLTTGVIAGHAGILVVDLNNPGGSDTNPVMDASAYLLGADGFFNHWFDGNIALQADLNAEFAGPLEFRDGEMTYATWLNGAGHLAYRDPERFAVALFGALQSQTYLWDGADPNIIPYGLIGAEGQVYTDTLTFYGQAGLALDLGPEPNTNDAFWRDYGNFVYVRGVLRFFPTDNLKLSAEGLYGIGGVTYGSFPIDPEVVPTTLVSARVAVDYRPDDQEFSLFAAYQAGLNTQSISGVTRSSLEHRLTAGVKFDIGAESLKARDREGVTWDVPQIAGLVGSGEQLRFCFDGDCPDFVPPPP